MASSTEAICTPAIADHPVRAALLLGALGVVFGDIGTSPIYAFRDARRAGVVDYGKRRVPISFAPYRANGYRPTCDKLPFEAPPKPGMKLPHRAIPTGAPTRSPTGMAE